MVKKIKKKNPNAVKARKAASRPAEQARKPIRKQLKPSGKVQSSQRKQVLPSRKAVQEASIAAKLKNVEKNSEGRKRVNVSVPQPQEVKEALDTLFSNDQAVEYLKKNVSKMAVDVIGMLVTPKTDEYLAEQMGTKINAIRRILNIMQGYGITNYYISKNTKGWLSFAWYINISKLPPFLDYVAGMEHEKSIVNESCNDYFVCKSCYESDRFVFTFDSAYENAFKCNNCGKGLERMDRNEAQSLISGKSS